MNKNTTHHIRQQDSKSQHEFAEINERMENHELRKRLVAIDPSSLHHSPIFYIPIGKVILLCNMYPCMNLEFQLNNISTFTSSASTYEGCSVLCGL